MLEYIFIMQPPVCRLKKKNVTYISDNQFYSGMHWTARKKIADAWHKATIDAIKQYKLEPFDKPVGIIFTFNNRYDICNNSMMCKMIIDGIVSAGILKDDTKKYLKYFMINIGLNDFIGVRIYEDKE